MDYRKVDTSSVLSSVFLDGYEVFYPVSEIENYLLYGFLNGFIKL